MTFIYFLSIFSVMHSNRLFIIYLSSFKCYFFTYFYYYYLSQNPIHFNILSTNEHQPKLYCIFINNTHKTQIFSSITPIKPRFLSSTTSTFHNLLLNHFNYFTHFIHLRERERERERDAVKEKVGRDPPLFRLASSLFILAAMVCLPCYP